MSVRSGPNRGMFVGAEGNGHTIFAILMGLKVLLTEGTGRGYLESRQEKED